MRMRRRNNLAPRMEACESVWIHEPEALRGNWRSLMPGCRELRVEVGCGKGKFTVETAEAEPDVLLIAIERVQDALVLAMEAAIRKGLKNVFFVSLDAANIDQFFADDEIDLLYINFCDPWPRKKNAKRRLTYHTFLRKIQEGPEARRADPLQDRQRQSLCLEPAGDGELLPRAAQCHRRSARERPGRHHDRL